MSEPVHFAITLDNGLWSLEREGAVLHRYSHVDRAVHEAVELARELERTGQPALVEVQGKDGRMIQITTREDPTEDDEGDDADLDGEVLDEARPQV